MPPEQQNTGYSPDNQYDFIVNPGQPPKKSIVPSFGGGLSLIKKIIFIGGGAVVLLILIIILASIFSGGDGRTEKLIALVQKQQEIVRVSAEGAATARADVRNASASIRLTTISQQGAWLRFLAREGTELDEERRELLQNATTDKEIADARASNTFDITYLNIMRTYLTDYASAIQTDFQQASGNTERALLQKHYDQTVLLLEQLPER